MRFNLFHESCELSKISRRVERVTAYPPFMTGHNVFKCNNNIWLVSGVSFFGRERGRNKNCELEDGTNIRKQ